VVSRRADLFHAPTSLWVRRLLVTTLIYGCGLMGLAVEQCPAACVAWRPGHDAGGYRRRVAMPPGTRPTAVIEQRCR